jgi:pimeloyl-ACP methyl ester carboxylesterase
MMLRIAAAAVLAAALAPVSGTAPAASSSCLGSLPQLKQVTTGSPRLLAGSTPVLFVHGINSGPGVWNPSSASSISGRAAAIAGVTAWTFSYAHQSLQWVTNQAIGPDLAAAITCLSAISGHKVIIVGHSMGGLAARYALGQDHGQVAARTAELITIGTPFQGSQILTDAEKLINGSPPVILADPDAVLIEAILSACAGLADHSDTSPCWLAAVLRSPVGTALEAHSPAIAGLPAWPARFPVYDTAGDMKVSVGVFGYHHVFDFGDGAGTVASATAHNTTGTPEIVHCAKTIRHILSIDTSLCFHTSLPHNPAIITAVLAAIQASLPSACPSSAQLLTALINAPPGYIGPGADISSFDDISCWHAWVVANPIGNGNGWFVFSQQDGLHILSTTAEFQEFNSAVCSSQTSPSRWKSVIQGPADCNP